MADDRLFEVDEVLPHLGEAQHFFELEALGFLRLILEVLILLLRAALDEDSLLSFCSGILFHGEKEVRSLLLDVAVDASPQVASAVGDFEFLFDSGIPACCFRRSYYTLS